MERRPDQIRALHVHDAASVGRNLVDVAVELGHPWTMTDIPWYFTRAWPGPTGHLVKRTRGAVWDATLGMQSLRADVVHLHTGGLSPHARWLRTPWILHLHGTDVRTRQYEGEWIPKLRYGIEHADQILYSTPDLKKHVENLTDRAAYLPVTVRLDRAPTWRPVAGRVIFASRWDPVKGAQDQIEVAVRLKKERPDLELLGLDWGAESERARDAGVTIVPTKSHDDYREWLATASVVIGQMIDVLGVSELEALAIGVPLVSSVNPENYPQLQLLSAAEPAGVAAGVLSVLDDVRKASSVQNGPGFIGQVHDAKVGVRTLLDLYSLAIEQRRSRRQGP
ncbi:glycosyltransferase family protein [Arthrobacter sp. TMN-50]